MEDNRCVAITYKGTRCTCKKAQGDRCNPHHSILINEGPTRVLCDEHDRKFKRLRREIKDRYDQLMENCVDAEQRKQLRRDYNREVEELNLQKEEDIDEIERRADERVAADEAARMRRDQRHAQEMAEWQRLNRIHQAEWLRNNPRHDIVLPAVANNTTLLNIVSDSQSVHRELVVKNVVNKAVDTLLKIEVPKEYQWNANSVSKTVLEIMTKCDLSVPAAKDLCSKYLSDEDIYNLGRGIYGRTLDGVWQYIINKKDNEDMIKVLKQELQDNAGMCAQGQLTRICNVLAGYIEDIGVGESITEILGREFSKLMEIESVTERLSKGVDILEKHGLPTTKWQDWLKPLED